MSLYGSLVEEIKETYRFRFVISNFVKTTLKLRYRKTVLGFFWSLAGPVLNYLVVGLVFAYTMKSPIPNYAAYLFVGALYFNVISGVTNRAAIILLGNEHYIKKIYLPKLVFVLETVLVELVNFILGFLALLALGLVFQKVSLSYHYIFLLYSIFLVAMLVIGIGSILSVAGVYFRDLIHVIPILVQAVFFLTPILYEISFLPPSFQTFVKFNPIYYYIEVFRAPILRNTWPNMNYVVFCSIFSFIIFIFGLLILKRYENKIVFRL